MRIHRLSDKEIDSLNIPVQKYEEDLKFKDFKQKAGALLGDESIKYMKYILALYAVIDLYSLTSAEKKSVIVKLMEKMGLSPNTIEKVDNGVKLGLSASYLSLLLLKKHREKDAKLVIQSSSP